MGWLRLSAQEEMYWRTFRVNQRVDIIIDMDIRETYFSRIEVVNENCIIIEAPRMGTAVLEVIPNAEVIVNVYTDHGLFKFKSKITAQDWDNRYAISVAKPRSIERIQRRQFYRLNVIVPVEYGVVPVHGAPEDLAAEVVTNLMGVTRNISEGGLVLIVDRPFSLEVILKLRINLRETVWAEGLAVVKEQKKLEVEDKFLTRLQFVSIREREKDAIRKFVVTQTHHE
jgi:c-di-GMP-binding flagellar brake protein YcgR